ncbi:MAG: diguanylate cyclase [Polyangiaceae bacterium]
MDDGSPRETSAIRAFYLFPSALAILDARGVIVAVNSALVERFGGEPRVVTLDAASNVAAGTKSTVEPVSVRVDDRSYRAEAHIFRFDSGAIVAFDLATHTNEVEALRARVDALERFAATDYLTGTWNRAHFERVIQSESERQPISLMLFDIDFFKRVNDTFGHAAGDSVLREVVEVASSSIRPSDTLFRWGGEEFAVLLAVGYRGAARAAERVRAAIAARAFAVVGRVTVSIGVAERLSNEALPEWFARLDESLYAAKRGGRDRVIVDRRGASDLAMPSIPLRLEWQESYECGEPTIDREHQALFEQVGRVLALIGGPMRTEKTLEPVRAEIRALRSTIEEHFTHEEALLAAHRYPDLRAHARAHAGLLRRAAYLEAKADRGEVSFGEVVEFLALDVVTRHLLNVDRAYFPIFQSDG